MVENWLDDLEKQVDSDFKAKEKEDEEYEHIRIPKPLYREFEALAQEHGTTAIQVIRNMIRWGMVLARVKGVEESARIIIHSDNFYDEEIDFWAPRDESQTDL